MRFGTEFQFRARSSDEPTFTGAELLAAGYLTEPTALEENLPKGFVPVDQPLVTVFVASYPQTNFGSEYREAALLVSCRYKEQIGSLCLGIVVDDDVALILGREVFGYPKKMADITLDVSSNTAVGKARRKGVDFLEVRAELGPASDMTTLPQAGPTFLVKAFPAADLTGVEWQPKVVSSKIAPQVKEFRPAKSCEITLRESTSDPWAAFPVKDVLFGGYIRANLTMAPGEVLGEIEASDWLPFVATNLR